MPYKSKAQAAYLHINEPALAAKWDKEGSSKKSLSDHFSDKLKVPNVKQNTKTQSK